MALPNLFLCVFGLASMLALAACRTVLQPAQNSDVVEDKRAINALLDQYTTAVNSNDAAAVAAAYTDDAIVLPPNRPAVEGKRAIQVVYEAMFKANAMHIAFTALETEVAGDWAYQRGKYALTVTLKSGSPVEDAGKYLVIAKRVTGNSWKWYRDVWSSNNAPRDSAGEKK